MPKFQKMCTHKMLVSTLVFVPHADSSDIGPQLDVQNTLYGYAPTDVCVTLALVLVLIGGSFGSVALALRLLVTVLISLCVTYGAMVRTQTGTHILIYESFHFFVLVCNFGLVLETF
jgi:hypothetical protein